MYAMLLCVLDGRMVCMLHNIYSGYRYGQPCWKFIPLYKTICIKIQLLRPTVIFQIHYFIFSISHCMARKISNIQSVSLHQQRQLYPHIHTKNKTTLSKKMAQLDCRLVAHPMPKWAKYCLCCIKATETDLVSSSLFDNQYVAKWCQPEFCRQQLHYKYK